MLSDKINQIILYLKRKKCEIKIGFNMDTQIKDLSVNEFKELVETTVRQSVEGILEDYIAMQSKNYILSVAEARQDYKTGNYKTLGEMPDA